MDDDLKKPCRGGCGLRTLDGKLCKDCFDDASDRAYEWKRDNQ